MKCLFTTTSPSFTLVTIHAVQSEVDISNYNFMIVPLRVIEATTEHILYVHRGSAVRDPHRNGMGSSSAHATSFHQVLLEFLRNSALIHTNKRWCRGTRPW